MKLKAVLFCVISIQCTLARHIDRNYYDDLDDGIGPNFNNIDLEKREVVYTPPDYDSYDYSKYYDEYGQSKDSQKNNWPSASNHEPHQGLSSSNSENSQQQQMQPDIISNNQGVSTTFNDKSVPANDGVIVEGNDVHGGVTLSDKYFRTKVTTQSSVHENPPPEIFHSNMHTQTMPKAQQTAQLKEILSNQMENSDEPKQVSILNVHENPSKQSLLTGKITNAASGAEKMRQVQVDYAITDQLDYGDYKALTHKNVEPDRDGLTETGVTERPNSDMRKEISTINVFETFVNTESLKSTHRQRTPPQTGSNYVSNQPGNEKEETHFTKPFEKDVSPNAAAADTDNVEIEELQLKPVPVVDHTRADAMPKQRVEEILEIQNPEYDKIENETPDNQYSKQMEDSRPKPTSMESNNEDSELAQSKPLKQQSSTHRPVLQAELSFQEDSPKQNTFPIQMDTTSPDAGPVKQKDPIKQNIPLFDSQMESSQSKLSSIESNNEDRELAQSKSLKQQSSTHRPVLVQAELTLQEEDSPEQNPFPDQKDTTSPDTGPVKQNDSMKQSIPQLGSQTMSVAKQHEGHSSQKLFKDKADFSKPVTAPVIHMVKNPSTQTVNSNKIIPIHSVSSTHMQNESLLGSQHIGKNGTIKANIIPQTKMKAETPKVHQNLYQERLSKSEVSHVNHTNEDQSTQNPTVNNIGHTGSLPEPDTNRHNSSTQSAFQNQDIVKPMPMPPRQEIQQDTGQTLSLNNPATRSPSINNMKNTGATGMADEQAQEMPLSQPPVYTADSNRNNKEQTYNAFAQSAVKMPFHMQLSEKIDIDLDDLYQNPQGNARVPNDIINQPLQRETATSYGTRTAELPLSPVTGRSRNLSRRSVARGRHFGYRKVRKDTSEASHKVESDDGKRPQFAKADRESLLRIMSAVELIKHQLDEMDLSKRVGKISETGNTAVHEKQHEEFASHGSTTKKPGEESQDNTKDNHEQTGDKPQQLSTKVERSIRIGSHSHTDARKRDLQNKTSTSHHLAQSTVQGIHTEDTSGISGKSGPSANSLHICMSKTSNGGDVNLPVGSSEVESTVKQLHTMHKSLHSIASKLEKGLTALLDQVTDFSNMEETDIKANRDKIFLLQTSMNNRFEELKANVSKLLDYQNRHDSALNESLVNFQNTMKRIEQLHSHPQYIAHSPRGDKPSATTHTDGTVGQSTNYASHAFVVKNNVMEDLDQDVNTPVSEEKRMEESTDSVENDDVILQPSIPSQLDGETIVPSTKHGNKMFKAKSSYSDKQLSDMPKEMINGEGIPTLKAGAAAGSETRHTDTKQKAKYNMQTSPISHTVPAFENDNLVGNSVGVKVPYNGRETIPNTQSNIATDLDTTYLESTNKLRGSSSTSSGSNTSTNYLKKNLDHIQNEIITLKDTIDSNTDHIHGSTDSLVENRSEGIGSSREYSKQHFTNKNHSSNKIDDVVKESAGDRKAIVSSQKPHKETTHGSKVFTKGKKSPTGSQNENTGDTQGENSIIKGVSASPIIHISKVTAEITNHATSNPSQSKVHEKEYDNMDEQMNTDDEDSESDDEEGVTDKDNDELQIENKDEKEHADIANSQNSLKLKRRLLEKLMSLRRDTSKKYLRNLSYRNAAPPNSNTNGNMKGKRKHGDKKTKAKSNFHNDHSIAQKFKNKAEEHSPNHPKTLSNSQHSRQHERKAKRKQRIPPNVDEHRSLKHKTHYPYRRAKGVGRI